MSEPDPDEERDDTPGEQLPTEPEPTPEPDKGATVQPDMGEELTQPATGATTTAPAQPTQPTQPTGQPAPAPQTLHVPPATTTTGNPPVPVFVAPPADAGGHTAAPAAAGTTDPNGFPQNTPWRDMQPAEQVAYWQHQARRHEDRVKSMDDYDQLKQVAAEYQRIREANQTEQEKLVADARRQGHAEALAAAGGQLVEQWVRAATAGRLPQESVNALLGGLDRARFLKDGAVDTDKVYAFVNSIAPAAVAQPQVQPGQPAAPTAPATAPAGTQPLVAAPAGGAPDFGQGQPATSRPSGLAAGREIARQRFAAQAKK